MERNGFTHPVKAAGSDTNVVESWLPMMVCSSVYVAIPQARQIARRARPHTHLTPLGNHFTAEVLDEVTGPLGVSYR